MSFKTDYKAALPVFIFTMLVNPFASLSALVISSTLAIEFLERTFGKIAVSSNWYSLPLLCFIVILAIDFSHYIVHLMLHKVPVLWNFHRVHHSAEVLTPLTAFARFHPLERIFIYVMESSAVGIITGPCLYLLGENDLGNWAVVYGVTKVINFVLEPFRHSHVWISYGRPLNYIFLSPCMHQIHHSALPEHRDRNMGEMLSIWDYMFGTIHVPATHERFSLGISDHERGAHNPHKSLLSLLLEPFVMTYRMASLRGSTKAFDVIPEEQITDYR